MNELFFICKVHVFVRHARDVLLCSEDSRVAMHARMMYAVSDFCGTSGRCVTMCMLVPMGCSGYLYIEIPSIGDVCVFYAWKLHHGKCVACFRFGSYVGKLIP